MRYVCQQVGGPDPRSISYNHNGMSEESKALTGDAWGGFAASLVVLPQSIAFGVAIYAALGPAYAAYGALAGFLGAAAFGLVASSAGGAPRLISTPCAPAAAVMAPLVAGLLAQARGPEHVMVLMLVAGVMTGLLQIAYGLLGGGRLIKYIPYPVVTGYLSGVAVLIVLGQGPLWLGLPKGTGLGAGLWRPELWRWEAVVVGAATMTAMLAALNLTKKVPATVVGLGCGLLAYLGLAFLNPALRTVAGNPLVIGPLGGQASGFWTARWAEAASLGLSDLRLLFFPALTLSVLLSIDTLKTCVVLDALTRSRHDSNRELVGQGLGNLISGLAGGVPGAGAMAPTVVNLSSGGRTRRSGLLCGFFTVTAFLLLGRALAWLPLAALAGMLIVLAGRMFDWSSLRLLRQRSTHFDFAVAAAVVTTAVAGGLIMAAGVGLALSILVFIRDQTRSSVVRRKLTGDQVSSRLRRLPEEAAVLAREGGQIAIFELQGSLFFGTADQLFTEVEPEFARRHYFIFDMRRVLSVDFTAAHVLDMIEDRLAGHGGRLLFADLPRASPTGQDLQLYFDELGLTRTSRRAHLFKDTDEARAWAEDRILARHLAAPGGPEQPLDLEQVELLKDLEPELMEALSSCVSLRALAPGEALFKQGDGGADEMYFIRRGRVGVDLEVGPDSRHLLAAFAKGDFFGEMAFLDRGRRAASATALVETELFALSRARFDQVAPQRPELGRKFFWRLSRALALRLRHADAEITALHEA